MKDANASLPHVSGFGRQISDELELTANPDVDRMVGKWLTWIFPLPGKKDRELLKVSR